MPYLTFRLRTISPAFTGGANPRGTPDMRSASVRGQLRYWLRAIQGARHSSLDSLWRSESAILGSTEVASSVSVRMSAQKINVENTPMLPHREEGGGNVAPALAIVPGTQCDLTLVVRPGVEMPELFLQSLSTWLLLGGIGKRSRRMFGAFQIREVLGSNDLLMPEDSVRAWWLTPPTSPDAYTKIIQDHFENWLFVSGQPAAAALPTFPTLHPHHSRVVVMRQPFASAKAANQAFFNQLLRTPKYRQHEQLFGFAKDGRRASPLIAQVRRLGKAYFIVVTFMASPLRRPDRVPTDWGLVHQLLNDAEELFTGQTVWGAKPR